MTGQSVVPHALASFLPIAVDDQHRLVVRQFGELPFPEAFFGATAAHAGAQAPTTRLAATALLAIQPQLPPPPLILHVGRCGSTLLCRLLDATGRVVTYREPDVVLAATEQGGDTREAVRAVVQQFAWHANTNGRVAVLKLASVGTRMLDGLIPEVPRVYLVRDALPVVNRVLRDPPVWLQQTLPAEWVAARQAADQPLDAFADDGGLDNEVREAMVDVAVDRWNDVVSAALAWSTDRGALLVDHADLVAEPLSTARRVLAYFQAHESDGDSDQDAPLLTAEGIDDSKVNEILGRHAKTGAVLAEPGRAADPAPLGTIWETRVMSQTLQRQQQLDQWRAEQPANRRK